MTDQWESNGGAIPLSNGDVEYEVLPHRVPQGWAAFRKVHLAGGGSVSHMIAIYRTEERAMRVVAFLQAVRDQGDEVDEF